jgi:hypothetical protein
MKNIIVLLTTVDFYVNAVFAVSIFWSALYVINYNLPKLQLNIINETDNYNLLGT